MKIMESQSLSPTSGEITGTLWWPRDGPSLQFRPEECKQCPLVRRWLRQKERVVFLNERIGRDLRLQWMTGDVSIFDRRWQSSDIFVKRRKISSYKRHRIRGSDLLISTCSRRDHISKLRLSYHGLSLKCRWVDLIFVAQSDAVSKAKTLISRQQCPLQTSSTTHRGNVQTMSV